VKEKATHKIETEARNGNNEPHCLFLFWFSSSEVDGEKERSETPHSPVLYRRQSIDFSLRSLGRHVSSVRSTMSTGEQTSRSGPRFVPKLRRWTALITGTGWARFRRRKCVI
jgi:hypothetical protein